jgi:AcrR family transcriptional regulator
LPAAPPATPRPSGRETFHHGDLRSALIAAVGELIEVHGPDGFSVAQAARRAGVSSAAPYKHFRDRPEILRAVVAAGMDRLHAAMQAAAQAHPPGSVDQVAAIGLAYVDFARAGPGVFRLVFGLTEGHEADPTLQARGQACFDVVARAVAARLCQPLADDAVQRSAYVLWTCVHGHAFLTIDRKTEGKATGFDDRSYLATVARLVLAQDPALATSSNAKI